MDNQIVNVAEPINPLNKLLCIKKDIDDLSLEDLKSLYADVARKVALLNGICDVTLVNNWYMQDKKNRVVEYTFFPKKKHTSCILFIKEFIGAKRHWVFTHESPIRLTRKVLKNLVSAQAVKQMSNDGIKFQCRDQCDEKVNLLK